MRRSTLCVPLVALAIAQAARQRTIRVGTSARERDLPIRPTMPGSVFPMSRC